MTWQGALRAISSRHGELKGSCRSGLSGQRRRACTYARCHKGLGGTDFPPSAFGFPLLVAGIWFSYRETYSFRVTGDASHLLALSHPLLLDLVKRVLDAILVEMEKKDDDRSLPSASVRCTTRSRDQRSVPGAAEGMRDVSCDKPGSLCRSGGVKGSTASRTSRTGSTGDAPCPLLVGRCRDA